MTPYIRPHDALGTSHVSSQPQKLHFSIEGQGERLVLLHGLGLHSMVWRETSKALSGQFCVTSIDLPGHGRSAADLPLNDLDQVADALAKIAPGPAIYVGWSLGGLVAMHFALRYPDRVSRLVLIGSTPRFALAADWPHGLGNDIFEAIGFDYGSGCPESLRRFLGYQAKGSAGLTRAFRLLLAAAAEFPAQAKIFRQGVDLLRSTDLRHRMGEIRCPIRFIMGEKDAFVASALGIAAARLAQDGNCVIIPGAGHVPLFSHPDRLLAELTHAFEH